MSERNDRAPLQAVSVHRRKIRHTVDTDPPTGTTRTKRPLP